MPEISLIQKKQEFEFKFSFWNIIFYFPIVFLVLAVLIFFGFFVYNFILQKSIESVNKEITAVESQRDLAADEKFISDSFNLNNRIQNLKGILDGHIYTSNLFSFFEKTTLPKTKFLGLSTDFVAGKIGTKGETEGYIGLVKQIIIFSRTQEIKEAAVSGIALTPSGRIAFDLNLSFDKKILFEKKTTND